MKILVTPTSFKKSQNKEAREMLERYADEIVYNNFGRPLNPHEIIELLEGVDGYIAGLDYITKEVLENSPKTLKVISRYGAGVDRVDLEAAKKRGIKVTNTPGTNSIAVCELAFGLMLSLARSLPELNSKVKNGEWPRNNGIELYGKTLGIIGFGAIGKELAIRAKAFGMKVISYDPYFDYEYAKIHDICFEQINTLLSSSDFVSLHVPLNEHTRHLISEKEICNMKDGAFIINTARGGLIDEYAAAEALESGKLAGIGLDAYEVEPPSSSPLFKYANCIMTPHTGAHTNEAVSAMGSMAVKNLIDVLEGKENSNIIT